jgi:hypothetical protein
LKEVMERGGHLRVEPWELKQSGSQCSWPNLLSASAFYFLLLPSSAWFPCHSEASGPALRLVFVMACVL